MLRTISEFSIFQSSSFEANFIRLIDLLQQKELVREVDAQLARAWVSDLQSLNYSWPTITRDFPPFTPPQGPVFDFRRFSLDEIDDRSSANSSPSLDRHAARVNDTAHTKDIPKTAESKSPRSSRTAVCVTGQIRSLNMKPGSPTWPGRNRFIPAKWDFFFMKKGSTVVKIMAVLFADEQNF